MYTKMLSSIVIFPSDLPIKRKPSLLVEWVSWENSHEFCFGWYGFFRDPTTVYLNIKLFNPRIEGWNGAHIFELIY